MLTTYRGTLVLSRNMVIAWMLAIGYSGFGFSYPTSNRFYQSLGMTLGEIQWLRSFQSFSFMAMLLVSAWSIRRWGLTQTVQTGATVLLGAALIYVFSSDPRSFYLAEFLHAFGIAPLLVGIPVIIQRELIAVGREDQLPRHLSIAIFCEMASWSIANVLGSMLASVTDPRQPFILAALAFAMGAFAASFQVRRAAGTQQAVSAPKPRWLPIVAIVLAFGSIAGAYRAFLSLQPSYLEQSGLPTYLLGTFSAILYLAVSLAALSATVLDRRMSIFAQFAFFALLSASTAFLTAQYFTLWGWVLILPIAYVRGASRVTSMAEIQRRTALPVVIAALSVSERIGAMLWLAGFGIVIDEHGLAATLRFFGVALLGLCALYSLGAIYARRSS